MIILYIILFVFGILQIILFFKLWGMTNDIRAMKGQDKETYKELEYYMKSINEYLRRIEDKTSNLPVNDKKSDL